MSFFDEDDEPRPASGRAAAAPQPAASRPIARPCYPPAASRSAASSLMLILLVVRRALAASSSRARRTRCKRLQPRGRRARARSPTRRSASRSSSSCATRAASRRDDLQTTISGYRGQARDSSTSRPSGSTCPTTWWPPSARFLIALELRRDGLAAIATSVRTALATRTRRPTQRDQRDRGPDAGVPRLRRDLRDAHRPVHHATALREAEIGGPDDPRLASSSPASQWLRPTTVAEALGQPRRRAASATRAASRRRASTARGSTPSTRRRPDAAARRAEPHPGHGRATFIVTFTNQGENDETDVQVVLRIEGAGEPIRVQRTVESVAQGATAEADAGAHRGAAARSARDHRRRGPPGAGRGDDRQQLRRSTTAAFTQQ